MKRFMKGCAITALIFLVLGFSMVIAAGTVEGANTISEVVQSVTNGKVHLNFGSDNGEDWGFFIDEGNWEEAEILYDIDDNMLFDDDYEIWHGDIEKYAIGSHIKKMDIEAGGCAFYFEESEDDNFYIEATGVNKLQCYVKSDILYVKASHTLKDWEDYDEFEIILYIPKEYRFEQVEVELGAGLLEVEEIASNKMNLQVGAGQITVDYLVTEDCEIEVGMGEIVVDDMQITKMNAEVGMGHLMMGGTILGDVNAECSMGSMELELTGKEADFNYTLETAMGNVTIGDTDYSGLAQEKTVENSANKNMAIECAMGNLEVHFED